MKEIDLSLFSFLFVFCSAGDPVQGLTYVRQTLCHRATSSVPPQSHIPSSPYHIFTAKSSTLDLVWRANRTLGAASGPDPFIGWGRPCLLHLHVPRGIGLLTEILSHTMSTQYSRANICSRENVFNASFLAGKEMNWRINACFRGITNCSVSPSAEHRLNGLSLRSPSPPALLIKSTPSLQLCWQGELNCCLPPGVVLLNIFPNCS